MCRRGNDLAALFPRYPTLHSRLAGSRRPEIRLRFSADLPGQRNREREGVDGEGGKEEEEEELEKCRGFAFKGSRSWENT